MLMHGGEHFSAQQSIRVILWAVCSEDTLPLAENSRRVITRYVHPVVAEEVHANTICGSRFEASIPSPGFSALVISSCSTAVLCGRVVHAQIGKTTKDGCRAGRVNHAMTIQVFSSGRKTKLPFQVQGHVSA